jgi:hypothetical protein
MASRRNRIIYASQSVLAEGRILYRIQTLGSSTTFNITDMFELGQLNLTDVVDDSPEVAVTLEGMDYGSIYTMATLAKVPTSNLNHNIRQSDGLTFFGTVSGTDTSTGDLDSAPAFPESDSTGQANLVVKDDDGNILKYLHGVQLIDFGRECGVSKGVDIWSPIQQECALGSASNDIEFTKVLPEVYVNSIEFTYNSDDTSAENYNGETEQKLWLLNSARFVSWEEWRVGTQSGEIAAAAMAAKTQLILALDSTGTIATLEDGSVGFLKKDETGRPAILFQFARAGGLDVGESTFVPVFLDGDCIPSNVLQYFLYDSANNTLDFYANGLSSTLDAVLPAGRSAFAAGDKIFAFYAASEYAKETGKPAGADSTVVTAKYFAPIGTEDVEDVGGLRQGQVEAYLVDPDLIVTSDLTNATIGATSIAFSGSLASSIDLTNFVGLPLVVTDGPGKGGPAREIISATNSLSGDYNDGTINLGGSAWSSIKLKEDSTKVSTDQLIYVDDLCGIDESYAGADITVLIGSNPTAATISGVDVSDRRIDLTVAASGTIDADSDVLVSAEPTSASEVRIGDYELSLRLQSVSISADLTREPLKELGHLNPYARPLTLPIEFTVDIETTAGDLELFAKLAGKGSKYATGQLTDIDLADLLAKDNMRIVVQVYQQTDEEAGGTGVNRKVLSSDMFGDEYFVDGQRGVYTATDGSLREYPLKSIIVSDLRPTDEEYSLSQGDNATQSFSYRGTNSVAVPRGYVDVGLVVENIESQGE